MSAKNNTYDMSRINLWDAVPLDTPFQFCIEPTFLCNFSCNYCMHAVSREELIKQGFSFSSMNWEIFEKILKQLTAFPRKIKKITFSGFGEPLLDRRLPDMIRRIKEMDIAEKILVITNGVLLTPDLWLTLRNAGLDEIKISVQGMTSDKYKKICGVNINYDNFLNTLTYVYRNKGDCLIRIKIADTALDAGEDVEFHNTFRQICDYIAIEHIYAQFSFVNYEGKLHTDYEKNRFGYKFKQTKICSALFFKMNVLQDGRITFGYPDGVTYKDFNINEKALYDVWNSAERIKLLYDNLQGEYTDRKECITCTRWSYSVVPEDMLDGHEEKILKRMPTSKFSKSSSIKPIIICGNTSI